MKKFLLSLAVMALGVSAASATVYNVNDATAIDGTLVEEVNTDKTKAAKHYQPLNSLKLGDYTLAFAKNGGSSDPAYYYNMSTSEDTQNTIRLYKSNTLTLSSETGFGKVVITLKNSKALNATNILSASAGGFAFDAEAKTLTWVNSEAVKTVTFTMPVNKVGSDNPQAQIISFDITAETGDVPVAPEPETPTDGVTVIKATEFNGGQVAFVFTEGYVSTFEESKPFGYWMATSATLADEMIVSKTAVFTLTNTDKGYTITDCYGRFMGWDGSHWSFNAYKTADDGNSYWSVAMVDGAVKISNKAKSSDGKEVYLCGKVYNSNYEMVPTDRDAQTLPMLYVVKEGSGVAEVETEAAGEAVYYNLQGVKVAEPENGLYIKVQGNKATKVLVRK